MNGRKYLYRGALMLITAGTLTSCAPIRDEAPSVNTKGGAGVLQGSLYLYNRQGNQVCTIPMLNGIKAFENSTGYGCPNDNVYTWRVVSAKPGAGISFYNNGYCGEYYNESNYSWRIFGDEGTGITIPADAALSVQHDGSKGQIIYSGVETDGSGKQGQLYGKVSCVSIDHAQ